MKRLESAEDLACPPPWAPPTELEGRFEHVGLRGVGAGVGAMRSIEETIGPLELVSLEPLVAGFTTHAVASAELGVREQATLGLKDKSFALGHGISLHPWHRRDLNSRGIRATLGVETVTHQG